MSEEIITSPIFYQGCKKKLVKQGLIDLFPVNIHVFYDLFGGSRTYHRICCAVEDAGFEIRDCISWIYGSGFPKSMNVGLAVDKRNGVESPVVGTKKQSGAKFKLTHELIDNGGFNDPNRTSYDVKQPQSEWAGWGSCLKPAYEPIIVARKPFVGSLTDNIIEWGVGALNIDDCRVGEETRTCGGMSAKQPEGAGCFGDDNWVPKDISVTVNGRFPANIITDGSEDVARCFPSTSKKSTGDPYSYAGKEYNNKDTSMFNGDKPQAPSNYNDDGSAMRFFYTAKASAKDRNEGLENFEASTVDDGRITPIDNPFQRGKTERKNIHPTVKPTDLMQYLIRLVSPKGSRVLDPFMGSGSTGKACMYENNERTSNYYFIGIELTDEYLPIAKSRIDFACGNSDSTTIDLIAPQDSVLKKEALF